MSILPSPVTVFFRCTSWVSASASAFSSSLCFSDIDSNTEALLEEGFEISAPAFFGA